MIEIPFLYENTDRTMRYYGKKLKLSPSPGVGVTVGAFFAGLVTGFVVLPIVLPIVGFQVTKRWGPPKK